MNESEASWLYDYIDSIAVYVNTYYGDIRSDRLYAIFHQGKYGGGHPGYYYSDIHDNRNVIDCGYHDWTIAEGWVMDGPLHEVAHVVESTVHGKKNSPVFSLWGDSKWSEFFEYGFHAETGNSLYAEKKYNEFMKKTDRYPQRDTYWFRDWFYPLYRDYGGSQIMRNFFDAINFYWPFESRKMNWGEYMHFMNATQMGDFRDLAMKAFGWPPSWDTQYQQALANFPLNQL
jgi:hypothetical protein